MCEGCAAGRQARILAEILKRWFAVRWGRGRAGVRACVSRSAATQSAVCFTLGLGKVLRVALRRDPIRSVFSVGFRKDLALRSGPIRSVFYVILRQDLARRAKNPSLTPRRTPLAHTAAVSSSRNFKYIFGFPGLTSLYTL